MTHNNEMNKIYKEIATLRGHTGWVLCLTHYKNTLYSAGEDKTIRIWAAGTNTETFEEIATMRGHTGWTESLTLHGNKVYSGNWDSTIRVWNI